jgi:fatty acid CoA ligase FadD9
MQFAQLPDERAARDPHAQALADEHNGQLTNVQLLQRVQAAAEHLSKAGVGAGDVVAVKLFNRVELIISLFAAWRLGAAATPVNPSLTASEVDYQLSDCSARVLVCDDDSASAPGYRAVTLTELAEPLDTSLSPAIADISENAVALIIYTSGTTGRPKGVLLTHANVLAMAQSMIAFGSIGEETHSLVVLPLFHVNAMVASVLAPMLAGGHATIAGRFDPATFFSIVERVRPTMFSAVPTTYGMLAALPGDVTPDTSSVRYAFSAAAPIPVQLMHQFEARYGIPIIEGYGLSEETCAATSNPIDGERKPGTVGIALPGLQVAVMNEHGELVIDGSAGEVVVKGPTVMRGYLNRPEETAKTIVDGWLHTGDIGFLDADGYLTLIDRAKDMIIRGGENVYPKEIESALYTHPGVREAAVVGRPDPVSGEVPVAFVTLRDKDVTADDLLVHLRRSLAKYKLPAEIIPLEELPKNPVGKIDKPALRRRFTDLAATRAAELRALREAAADQPVLDTLTRAAQARLGLTGDAPDPGAHFIDLGGDSLSALSFSNLLQDIFGVGVPVGVIISPATNLGQLAEYIEAERESGSTRPTFTTVHGQGATEIRAADLALEKFIDSKTLADAPTLPPATHPPRTVLLTGANGYLGRFLCLEWLQRLSEADGKLICIVRGSDAETAQRRLEAGFDSGDPRLLVQFQELAADRLEVVAGDVGEPNLGLDEASWHRLAKSVDLIVHPAALVNHVLPYSQLFGPNVVGTAELIRLAITTQIKPVTYLSTVGVAMSVAPADFTEDGDIREVSPARPIDDTYANGYANSKWAGEVLLREAHDLCQLPVAVFRCDMILAHSRYVGQLNVQDKFTRLILSLLETDVAPGSFYQSDASGNRPRAHYGGLPCDFVAESITTLGKQTAASPRFRTFDVMNPHDDGISLDVFVDWLIEAGQDIQRIDNYDEWLGRFETTLRALPQKQRQHSVLPLLDAYREPEKPLRGAPAPTEVFRDAVQAAKIGADEDIPHLSASLIDKYIVDLQHLGLLSTTQG